MSEKTPKPIDEKDVDLYPMITRALELERQARSLQQKKDDGSKKLRSSLENQRNAFLLKILHTRTQRKIDVPKVMLQIFPGEILHVFSTNRVSFEFAEVDSKPINVSAGNLSRDGDSLFVLGMIGDPDGFLTEEYVDSFLLRTRIEALKAAKGYKRSVDSSQELASIHAMGIILERVQRVKREYSGEFTVPIGFSVGSSREIMLNLGIGPQSNILFPARPSLVEIISNTSKTIGDVGIGNKTAI